ncbi:FecR family protein [Arenibacter certesii]|uniref:FecR family protein n=1 Tax=Arenibacter certesii TaxID=228955 RepID=A0A918MR70_9FLAO|nr:FecR family protein [Arenibacter certesii]GGW48547.1 hypothetical protein GCM10007383_35790 [Arenibacter certesii]
MKKSKHNIEFFLENPDFVLWVKNPKGNRNVFWKTWLENHPHDRETIHNTIIFLNRINFATSEVSQIRKEKILGNILKNSPNSLNHHKRNFIEKANWLQPLILRTAAVVLLFLGVSLFFLNNFHDAGSIISEPTITKSSGNGEKVTFFLPDSTKVILNSKSTLKYPAHFSQNTREVTLLGEAYFDVQFDSIKQFLVKSGNITTKVHGTSFSINSYGGEEPISVALERGLVSVHSQIANLNTTKFDISPGEKIIIDQDFDKSIISTFDYESEFGWKDGVLIFNNSDLDSFIFLMERWYGININVIGKTDENWAINGRFKYESFESVFKSLEFSRGIKYKIEDNQVSIYINNN